ncbi:condensation domain-containing protein [Chitinophaga sancti]|uniref:Amino acid adenylation domain-containing protein n=1 Tax=Chitinophaga sancti TaxID=1004 RepID=A0A1K1SSJ2_9BACT|nr:condensation domain-containing protein [Chitinophaga sancti]WQD64518.1 condensation domain-containing protein [Chitinophaga sancti]WQG89857.1 condensation domain-containing protein [Chitinophaga sancti]SFW87188.1 amino acid adenylation domain-containing protein [Chitinophaga sancti]
MSNKIIHAEIEKQVTAFPDLIAVEGYNMSLTYWELNEYANQLAHALLDAGLRSEGTVGVYATGGPLQVIGLLGTFKAAGRYVPMSPDQALHHIEHVLEETSMTIVVTTAEHYPALQKILFPRETAIQTIIVLDQRSDKEVLLDVIKQDAAGFKVVVNENAYSSKNPGLTFPAENDAYIFYTSGSTGKSKGIVGSHIALSHYIHWHKQEWAIDTGFRISQLAPMTFDASLKDILTALISGATLCMPESSIKNNPVRLVEWLREANVTLLQTVPSVFRLITAALPKGGALPSLRYIVLAGERLLGHDVLRWKEANGTGARMSNLYGLTETTILKTCFHIDTWEWQPGEVLPVGMPISNTLVAVINSSNNICEEGEMGEVFIKSPYISKGYLDKSLNTGSLVQNPLAGNDRVDLVWKTGDLGRYRGDGSLEILGRRDEQVKINGVRVELEQIRIAMLKLEDITRVELLVHSAEDARQELICYYTGTRLAAAELRQLLSDDLNPALLPGYFVWMDTFPLNMNGKVDRKALPKPEEVTQRANYQPPRPGLEQQLALLWQQVLGIEKVGREDNFFNTGGSSLKAIQLIAKIYKELDVQLTIAELFANPIFSQLSAFIEQSKRQAYRPIPNVAESDSYILSSSQKRLWIASQMKEQSVAYNIPVLYRIKGALNIHALSEAFHQAVKRHESLRTVFSLIEGEPRQRILSPEKSGVSLVVRDLRSLTVPEEAAHQRAAEIGVHYFNLEKGPLLLAELLRIADEEFILACCIHHIIADEWSMQVLGREIIGTYNACVQGTRPELRPLKIQYKDYASWQQQELAGLQLLVSREFWLSRFGGELPVLNLPADRSRPVMQSFRGAQVKFRFDAEQNETFRQLIQEKDATLYIGLLTLVNILLFRYSGQHDLIVGTPVAGRLHPDLEDQIGYYLNTLALRNTIAGDASFMQVLESVRQSTIDAFSHQAYPFDLLIDELKLGSDLSRSPLFDVVLILQNIELNDDAQLEMNGVGMEIEPAKIEISKCDLRFQFTADKQSGILYGSIEYNTDIFDHQRIKRMSRHLIELMSFVNNSPQTQVSNVEYLSPEEKKLEKKAMGLFNSNIEETF